MNAPRFIAVPALLAFLLLPACSARPVLTSTLPAAVPYSSDVGVQIPALLPGTAGTVAVQQKAELEQRLRNAGAPVQLSLLPEDALGLRMAAADSFEAGSAQLQLAALARYAQIADVLKAFPGSVVHVLVYGDSVEPGDVALGIGARRAASILDYLAHRGVPLTRLRAEGRGAAGAGEWIELVLRPVVQGREAQAWTPPAAPSF